MTERILIDGSVRRLAQDLESQARRLGLNALWATNTTLKAAEPRLAELEETVRTLRARLRETMADA